MTIRCVIKGTKSISEYKETQKAMLEATKNFSEAHRAACETWTHGKPVKVWQTAVALCIEYEDGSWWQYRETPCGKEWW